MADQQIHGGFPRFQDKADLRVQPRQQHFWFKIHACARSDAAQPLACVFFTKLVVGCDQKSVKFKIRGLGFFKLIQQTREFAEVISARLVATLFEAGAKFRLFALTLPDVFECAGHLREYLAGPLRLIRIAAGDFKAEADGLGVSFRSNLRLARRLDGVIQARAATGI